MERYPVADMLTGEEIDSLRWLCGNGQYLGLGRYEGGYTVVAVRTGEFRKPRKGEWFLSGARPAAYRGFNDLSTEYHICRLVVKKKGDRK